MNVTASTSDTDAIDFIRTLVRNRSAIVLDSNKAYLIESRVAPIIRQQGFDSLEGLVSELRKPSSSRLADEVIEAMTTNETSFFRDLHPFNALKTKILPDLAEKRRATRRLTIWSNACSSGQEPYSIAMLIREHFPEFEDWDLRIIATDLSGTIIARAKSGTFNQTEVNRGLPMQMLMKYFSREGMWWVLNKHIREMVDFRMLNLLDTWPPMRRFDIVFFRNVLIYFDVNTKHSLLSQVRDTMAADGYLFLGGSETTIGLNVPFNREPLTDTVCYRPS